MAISADFAGHECGHFHGHGQQDAYDDHGSEVWPEVEWSEWQSEGQRLLQLVRHELGPGVEIQITF